MRLPFKDYGRREQNVVLAKYSMLYACGRKTAVQTLKMDDGTLLFVRAVLFHFGAILDGKVTE
jgi:hypothetical protein